MKNTGIFAPLWFVLFILLSGCAASASSGSHNVKLTRQDSGRSVDLRVGDSLTVTLPGNITTGYNWEVQPPVDGIVLKQAADPEYTADSNRTGSGGQITFVFQAVNPGQADLNLVYHRSWEKNVAPQDTFTVKVTVSQ